MNVISIGDLVTDFYYKNNKLVGVSGGMTSHNIIANIAKMGLNTKVFGIVGNDQVGQIAIRSLKDIGVNVSQIKILDEIHTRCFHVSYIEKNKKIEFSSKKRCPICNEKKWYEESLINPNEIFPEIQEEDVLIFDNLNFKNQMIIDGCQNKKMLDLGQFFELEQLSNEKIIEKIQNKFFLINLNERVLKYLKERFNLKTLQDVYNLLKPEMLIVTKGKKGAAFVFKNKTVNKILDNPAPEVDPTGAGDAFFSVFISEVIKNNYFIDETFIDATFKCASKLTRKVVKSFGARGHLQSLYKIKPVKNICTCKDFEIILRKQIKRCNINVNHLEKRILNAINSSAYQKLIKIDFQNLPNSLFIGTGGSFAGAKFSSKVINTLYGTNAFALYPREVYYRNNQFVDAMFLFTYSGTTNDLIVSTKSFINKKKYIITKGELQDVVTKTDIPKNNILSYRTGTNKGKERGFLAFEGVLAPSSLFLKLYFEKNSRKDIEDFIKNCINYWKNYFEKYFKENKNILKDFLKSKEGFNIFVGDFTEAAGFDLESKLIESGIYNCLVHEKKNFSHGRFVNYEQLSNKKNIYLKQKTTSPYEAQLLEYLAKDQTLILESRYDGILCEYDLLIASQYLIYFISNYLNLDISKPTYSENAMKIYFYKGDL